MAERLFVKTMQGKILGFDFDTSEPVYKLKEMIQETEGMPIGQQRLLYQGQDLEDGNDVKSYDIHGMITLALSLSGGSQKSARK